MRTNEIYIDLSFNTSGSTGAVTSLVKNQSIRYRFNTNNPNGHRYGQSGGYYLNFSSPDTKIRGVLYQNGTAIAREENGCSIDMAMLLPYNQNYEFVVEPDDKTRDVVIVAKIFYSVEDMPYEENTGTNVGGGSCSESTDDNTSGSASSGTNTGYVSCVESCPGEDGNSDSVTDGNSGYGRVYNYIPFDYSRSKYLSKGEEVYYTFTANSDEAHNGGKGIYVIEASCKNPIYMVAYPSDRSIVRAVIDAQKTISMSLNLDKNTEIFIDIGISGDKSGTVNTKVTYKKAEVAPKIVAKTEIAEIKPVNTTKENKVADPVDAYTGSHTMQNKLISLFGGQNLSITALYNSNHIGLGDLGYGWYHNYEKRIVIVDNEIYVYESPNVYYKFISTNVSGLYNCTTASKSGYKLNKTYDGYILDCNSDHREYYDSNGRLVKIINKYGLETILEYNDNTIVITDAVTNKSVYLEKNESGFITSLRDDFNRTVTLEYLNGCLISICDVNSNKLSFTYNNMGKIERGTDDNGTVYFTNVYNHDGKVVTQFDSFGSVPTVFEYIDNKRIIRNRKDFVSTRVYNEQGLLSQYIDENGNSKFYEYDNNFNVCRETDALGNSVVKEYNSFNKPTKITDKNGNITIIEYDSVGNVTKITHPNGGIETFEYNSTNQITKHTNLRGLVTIYTYDSNGMPASKKVGNKNAETYVYSNGLLMSETDAKGNTASYEYNSLGQMICKTDALNNKTTYEYDLLGNILKVTDAAGNSVSYSYDCNYQKISQTDVNGNTTSYTYNGNLKPVSTRLPDNCCSRNEYDEEDRVIKTVDFGNNETSYTYDIAGRLTKVEHPDCSVETYEYNSVGNVVKETNVKGAVTEKEYDANGNIISVTDADGNITRKQYDNMSRVIRTVSAVSGTTLYEYSLAGDLLTETDALGNRTAYTYDIYGNRLSVTDPKGNVTSFTYDVNNNMTSKIDALGNVTVYEYDSCNRLIRITDAKNQSVAYGYDALGRRISVTDAKGNTVNTTYDANGNVLTITDAKGVVISSKTYNKRNFVVSETDAVNKTIEYMYTPVGNVQKTTDKMDNETNFSYNSRGQLTSSRDSLENTSSATYDSLGNTLTLTGPLGGSTSYTYDNMGRMLSKSTVSGGTVEYQYNELGLKKQIKNARNQIHSFSYDIKGRIVGCVTPEDSISYTYDANGNILAVTDKNGTTTRTYDALNRIISCTDVNGNTIGYRYDSVGNLTAIVYPDNTEVTYTYDANNNLVTVTDWSGRVTAYTYDVNNLLIGVTKPDGSVTTTTYDDAHRIVSSVERKADGTVITGYEYTYDDLGRITTEKDLAKNVQICYIYDNLSRVTMSEITHFCCGSKTEEIFEYDAAGNVNINDEFEYDQNNRLTHINSHPIAYDMDGNMLNSYIDNECETYTYDSSNRLISTGNASYVYNAEDVRIRKTVGEQVTEYVYDTSVKLSKLLVMTAGGVTTKFVYGLGLIGQESAGSFKTYHYDYRGSTSAITDSTGTVTDTFTYDTYGKLTNRTGTTDTPFMYNGRDGVVTDENGLYYMRARYYHPEIKRFINADIVAGKISDAITLNRFAYANGNPVSNIDPFGLSSGNWWKFALGAVAIAGLAVATVCTGGAAGVIAAGALIGAVIGGTVGAVTGYMENGWDGAANGFLSGVIGGGASGALGASGASSFVIGIGNAGINVGESMLESLISDSFSDITIVGVVIDAATGFISGYLGEDGLLYKNSNLDKAMYLYEETIEKELRRDNKKYAVKAIDDITKYYNSVKSDELYKYAFNSTKDAIRLEGLDSAIGYIDENVRGK